jgi:hypothetical protein
VKLIPLSSGLHPNKFAMVDDADFDELMKYKWFVRESATCPGQFYAYRQVWDTVLKRGYPVIMHRQLVGIPGMSVDHKDHDGLNNQRDNIRSCTNSQNMQNIRKWKKPTSSKFKGVYWKSTHNRWVAAIRIGGKKKFIGGYRDEETAAAAYDLAARTHFGEFAHPNFKESA